jgi:hypothetical protein
MQQDQKSPIVLLPELSLRWPVSLRSPATPLRKVANFGFACITNRKHFIH